MNYLAHIFLSGGDRDVQLGNFIGDAVKGSSYNDYPPAVRKGILLHRAIDGFTDAHPTIKQAVQSLKPHFGRYSGILLDIYFDHLLASRFGEFSDVPLHWFSRQFYLTMIRRRNILPARIKNFMCHFILTDRLSKYAAAEGVRESLDIMVRYSRIGIDAEGAVEYLAVHENELRMVFTPFFAELRAWCESGCGVLSQSEQKDRRTVG